MDLVVLAREIVEIDQFLRVIRIGMFFVFWQRFPVGLLVTNVAQHYSDFVGSMQADPALNLQELNGGAPGLIPIREHYSVSPKASFMKATKGVLLAAVWNHEAIVRVLL